MCLLLQAVTAACHNTCLWVALVTAGEVFLGTFVTVRQTVSDAQVCNASVAQMHNKWTKSGVFHSACAKAVPLVNVVWEVYLHMAPGANVEH